MNCDTAAALLGPLADGEMGGIAALRLRLHAARCPACAAELRRVRRLDDLVRCADPAPALPAAAPAVSPQVAKDRRRRERRRRITFGTFAVASALTVRWVDVNQPPVYPIRTSIEPAKMDGPNAAHFYAAAMDAADPADTKLDPDQMTIAAQTAVVERNRLALALLRQGFQYRFQGMNSRAWLTLPAAGVSGPVPNSIAARDLERLLIADAHVRAARGDHAGAVSSALDVVRFGQDITHGDRSMIDGTLGMLIASVGEREVCRHVDRLNSSECRAALQRLKALQAGRPDIQEILTSAEGFGVSTYQSLFGGQPAALPGFGAQDFGNGFIMTLAYDSLMMVYGKQRLVDDYAGYMDEARRRARLPFQQAKALGPQPVPLDPLCRLGVPPTDNMRRNADRERTNRTIVQAALAARIYRLEQGGRPPSSLDELVRGPKPILASAPIDPFSADGAALLRYRDGRIYSVGENGRDDGGAGDDYDGKGTWPSVR